MNLENDGPELIKTKFRNVFTGKEVRIKIWPPIRCPLVNDDVIWSSNFEVESSGQTHRRTAKSEDAFGALLLAYVAATKEITSEEDDWESEEGMPAWLVVPKIIPVAWGKEFYTKVYSTVLGEIDRLNRELERRRGEE